MKYLGRFEPVWLMLVFAGALNWAMVGLFDTNVVTEVFGTGTFTDAVYAAVGFAALMLMPSMLERMHLPGHHGHRPAHGAR